MVKLTVSVDGQFTVSVDGQLAVSVDGLTKSVTKGIDHFSPEKKKVFFIIYKLVTSTHNNVSIFSHIVLCSITVAFRQVPIFISII